jgi:hypothetical protein
VETVTVGLTPLDGCARVNNLAAFQGVSRHRGPSNMTDIHVGLIAVRCTLGVRADMEVLVLAAMVPSCTTPLPIPLAPSSSWGVR